MQRKTMRARRRPVSVKRWLAHPPSADINTQNLVDWTEPVFIQPKLSLRLTETFSRKLREGLLARKNHQGHRYTARDVLTRTVRVLKPPVQHDNQLWIAKVWITCASSHRWDRNCR